MFPSCDVCKKIFSNKYSLNRHSKKFHGIDISSKKTNSTNANKPNRVCTICQDTFYNRNALYMHKRRKHRHLMNDQRKPLKIKLHSKCEKFVFSDVGEFSKWKNHLEITTQSSFVKSQSDRKFGNVTRRTYTCHRSGSYRKHGRGIRQIKVQGSCKIGSRCPASIHVSISHSGSVSVSYFPDHVGHEIEVAHMPLTRDQRTEIAGLLAMKLSFEEVIDQIQKSGDNSSVSRLNFLSKKDLQNIVRGFNLTKGNFQTETESSEIESSAALANNVSKDDNDIEECHTENDAVEHEEVILSTRQVDLDETDKILNHFQLSDKKDNFQSSVAKLEEDMAFIQSKVNVHNVKDIQNQMSRIRSWISANDYKYKRQQCEQKSPIQPSNTRITTQRRVFLSTKKTASKRKKEERLSKPDNNKKVFLLESLSGNQPIISRAGGSADDNYESSSKLNDFEHNYSM